MCAGSRAEGAEEEGDMRLCASWGVRCQQSPRLDASVSGCCRGGITCLMELICHPAHLSRPDGY